jgi:hypothetical protein
MTVRPARVGAARGLGPIMGGPGVARSAGLEPVLQPPDGPQGQ